jgi:hypothetical protein
MFYFQFFLFYLSLGNLLYLYTKPPLNNFPVLSCVHVTPISPALCSRSVLPLRHLSSGLGVASWYVTWAALPELDLDERPSSLSWPSLLRKKLGCASSPHKATMVLSTSAVIAVTCHKSSQCDLCPPRRKCS